MIMMSMIMMPMIIDGQWLANDWPIVGQWLADCWCNAIDDKGSIQWDSMANGWPRVGQSLCFLLFLYRFLFFLGLNGVLLEMVWLTDGQWMVNRWPVAGRLLANDPGGSRPGAAA